jgi:hypothetical protein
MSDDLADAFDTLLRHQDERDRAYKWPVEHDVTDRASREVLRAERPAFTPVEQDPAVVARVLASPDEDEPRAAYARWHRSRGTEVSRDVADFVDGQLALAAALRADPNATPATVLAPFAHAFASREYPRWWRYPPGSITGLAGGLWEPIVALVAEGLVDSLEFHRGFVEHVAMRAGRFLEVADELFALAPIRHLTLTYAKGPDHTDAGLFAALAGSPHLARIRSLQLPGHVLGHPHAELNRLTDEDLGTLVASPHLRRLGYLRFEDQPGLTTAALDAVVADRRLPALRVLRHEQYRYGRTAGDYGDHVRDLASRHDALPPVDETVRDAL